MNDKPETTFEFDPLPGDATVTTAQEKPPAPNPAKKKRDKAAKPERKKRGPRRVAPQQQVVTGVNVDAATGTATVTVATPRKKREPKADLAPEFGYIKQFMAMSEPTRKRVLAVLNKVFG